MPHPVSICVPTWNGEAYLQETLRSALTQTFADFELVVVDDASTDRSLEIAQSLGDPRVRIHRNPRRLGLARNWNRCLELANGDYIKFLFQDDVLAADALEALVRALDAEPDAPLAFGRREIRYDGPGLDDFPLRAGGYDAVLRAFYRSFRGRVTGTELIRSALHEGRDLVVNVVGEPSFVLLRRDRVRAAGGFDARFRQLPDWDLWLRLARDGPLVFVDRCLGAFRVHLGGASTSGLARVPRENVKLLARVRRRYARVLDADTRRRLRRSEWQHLARLVRERVRALWPPSRKPPELTPPPGAIFIGGGDFKETGDEFLRYFVDLAGLQPHHRVLDVGCGIGRMAVPLTRYLGARGRYDGFDVVPEGIAWCRAEITPRFRNFRFELADLHNGFYNQGGRGQASEYNFPYPDAVFDLVILASVFTHLLPPEMERYLEEIHRVLKPGGKALMTFFLLTPEVAELVASGRAGLDFRHERDGFWTVDHETPESAVAYSERSIRDRLSSHGLELALPLRPGRWCGREGGTSYQDMVVVRRP